MVKKEFNFSTHQYLKAWDILIPKFECNDWVDMPYLFLDKNHKVGIQYRWYGQIMSDLERVIKTMNLLVSYNDIDISLMDTLRRDSIMIYAKWFTQAEWRKVKLENSDLSTLDKWAQWFHHYILWLRNTYIAHAWNNGEEMYITTIAFVSEEIKESAKNVHMIGNLWISTMWWGGVEDYKKLSFLSKLVYDIAKQKSDKAYNKLLEEFNGDKNEEYFAQTKTYTQRINEMNLWK